MESRYLVRGKRTDNGEWVEGFYFCMTHPDGRHTHHFIIPLGADLSLGTPVEKIQVEVDPETICQCTGLRDKNGKLIFENDIVKEFNGRGDEWCLAKIVFGEHSLNLGWCEEGIKSLNKYDNRLFNVGFDANDANKCVVVGNIFDNPELLEV